MSAVVLLADDDPTILAVIKRALEKLDCDVTAVTNGQEAVEAFNSLYPDLVILDGVMPVMDGYQACERIKANLSGHDVPVMLVTALSDDESAAQALSAGADDFMAKPVNWAVFNFRVHRLMEVSKKSRKIHQLERFNPLTSLPNRESCIRSIQHALDQQKRASHALFIMDINRFSNVNETYGNELGDQLLINISHRLLAVVSNLGYLSHIGQDVFALLVKYEDKNEVNSLARLILDSFKSPFWVNEQEVILSCSLGQVDLLGFTHAEEAMSAAEVALAQAKAFKSGAVIEFQPYMAEKIKQQTYIESWLRKNTT